LYRSAKKTVVEHIGQLDSACVDRTHRGADLGIERPSEPTGRSVSAGRPGPQDLDEQQIEDPSNHHDRSLRWPLHLEQQHSLCHLEPLERLGAGTNEHDYFGQAGEQGACLGVPDPEGAGQPAGWLPHWDVRADRVAHLMAVAARQQHDVAASQALDVVANRDHQLQLAVLDDVQSSGTLKTNREASGWRVRNAMSHTSAELEAMPRVAPVVLIGRSARDSGGSIIPSDCVSN
jgi:hypothetical protein